MTPSALSNETPKPCPFCSGTDLALREHHAAPGQITTGEPYSFGCDICGAESGTFATEEAAIAAWNQRAPALITELLSYRSEGVAVKPLEWRNVDSPDMASGDWWFEAYSPFGNYTITFVERHTLPWLLEPFFSGLDSNYATEDQAKAAAQADYETRVRSALSPVDGVGEPVAWQYRTIREGKWREPATPGDFEFVQLHPEWYEVRPLYTSSALSPVDGVGEPAAWHYISPAPGAKWTVQKNYPKEAATWPGSVVAEAGQVSPERGNSGTSISVELAGILGDAA